VLVDTDSVAAILTTDRPAQARRSTSSSRALIEAAVASACSVVGGREADAPGVIYSPQLSEFDALGDS
jgi:hypothetical protein